MIVENHVKKRLDIFTFNKKLKQQLQKIAASTKAQEINRSYVHNDHNITDAAATAATKNTLY